MSELGAEQILEQISQLADQLCVTIDDDFDFRLQSNLDDDRVLKLVMMMNFLLDRVRNNIQGLADARDKLEQRVKERTELLQLVIDGSNDGVWIWHVNDNRLEVSRGFADVMGLLPESLTTPKDWFARVHPEDVSGLQLAIRQHIAGSQPQLQYQYRLKDSERGYRWVVLRGVMKRDRWGNASLVAGTQSDITRLMTIDQASGLPNEQAFEGWIEQHGSDKSNSAVALFAIDRLGALGDVLDAPQMRALRGSVRERLLHRVPLDAMVAQVGVDVLGIGMPGGEHSAGSIEFWENLCGIFDDPFQVAGYGAVTLSGSVGVKTLESNVESVADIERIVSALWSSVRKSRESEGSTVTFYNKALRAERAHTLRTETEVLRALQEDRVVAWFQPIVAARVCSIAGFEALVRIRRSDGSFMPPAEFIPLVEGSDLIGPLTETVLNQSLAQLAQWRAEKLVPQDCFMAVNLSSKHILNSNLGNMINRSLWDHRIPAQNLKLEVTETALVENIDIAIEQLQNLRKLGCKIAIDDFGTGYSSLEYLQRLPLDVLKLDRAFVKEVEVSRKPLAIARTVCDLARLLDLEVVAEGVETISQAELLESLGVGMLQGYWFRTPAAGIEMTEWLASDEAHRFERIFR